MFIHRLGERGTGNMCTGARVESSTRGPKPAIEARSHITTENDDSRARPHTTNQPTPAGSVGFGSRLPAATRG